MQFTGLRDDLSDGLTLQVMDFAKNREIIYQDEIKSAFYTQHSAAGDYAPYRHILQDRCGPDEEFFNNNIRRQPARWPRCSSLSRDRE